MACKSGCREEDAAIKKAINALLAYRQQIIDQLKKHRPNDVQNFLHPKKVRGSYANLAAHVF